MHQFCCLEKNVLRWIHTHLLFSAKLAIFAYLPICGPRGYSQDFPSRDQQAGEPRWVSYAQPPVLQGLQAASPVLGADVELNELKSRLENQERELQELRSYVYSNNPPRTRPSSNLPKREIRRKVLHTKDLPTEPRMECIESIRPRGAMQPLYLALCVNQSVKVSAGKESRSRVNRARELIPTEISSRIAGARFLYRAGSAH